MTYVSIGVLLLVLWAIIYFTKMPKSKEELESLALIDKNDTDKENKEKKYE